MEKHLDASKRCPPGLITLDTKLDWVLSERILASWQDGSGNMRYLGEPSPHNHATELTMCLGHDMENSKVLLTLHLPITLRASTSSSKPRNMFLIIPVENLDSQIEPEPVFLSQVELRRAGLVDSRKLLRVHFNLQGASGARVVMPGTRYDGFARGTPLRLLSSLRSLAEVRSFEVYLSFSSYALQPLLSLTESLRNMCLTTPSLDLPKMYHGRGGLIDAWECQGFDDNADIEVSNPLAMRRSGPHGKMKRRLEAPMRDETPPPPYEEGSASPDSHDIEEPGEAEVQVSRSDCNKDSPMPPRSCSLTSVVYETPPPAPHKNAGGESNDASLRTETSPAPASHKRKAESLASVDGVAASRVDYPRASGARCEPRHSTESHRHLDKLSNRQDLVAISAPEITGDDFTIEMTHWLFAAWRICPEAHNAFRSDLLALGAAARAGNIALFDQRRAACTAKLVLKVVDDKRSNTAIHVCNNLSMEQEIVEVSLYINSISRIGDIGMLTSLVALAEQDSRENFLIQKARCIAYACFCYDESSSI